VYGICLIGYHLWKPETDLKLSEMQMERSAGILELVSFDISNSAYLDIKDPVIACDMKGASGTTIKSVTKTLYEVIPSSKKRAFRSVLMGPIVEDSVYFTCRVAGAAVKW
jgi:hypothetical protein